MMPYNYTLMMKMEASYPLDDLIPTGIRQNGKAAQQTTRDILLEKHPKGKLAPDDALPDTSSTDHCHDPIIFE